MGSLEQRLRSVVDPVGSAPPAAPPGRRTAAVLLLFDTRDARLPLLFMQRTAHLRDHPGQIALPGGGSEPRDPTVVATALREAGEEAGIPRDAAEVIGLLPPFLTAVSDIWLTPVVALQRTDVDLRPDPFEVARLFRVDLRTLMEVPHTVRSVIHQGVSREVHTYEADGNVIWGVTGAILFELISRLGDGA
jgi:8-oxo-dGTP pyrophosphatase MutT (NUDIX family)